MALATITSKGQVTIPKEVRTSLNLDTGDQIEIVVRDGNALIRPISKKVEEVFGMLQAKGQKKLSVEEMDQAVAKKFRNQK